MLVSPEGSDASIWNAPAVAGPEFVTVATNRTVSPSSGCGAFALSRTSRSWPLAFWKPAYR